MDSCIISMLDICHQPTTPILSRDGCWKTCYRLQISKILQQGRKKVFFCMPWVRSEMMSCNCPRDI